MGEKCLLETYFDFTVTGNRGEMRVLTSTKQGKGRKNSNRGAKNAGAGSSSSKSSKDVAKLAVLSARLGSSVVLSPAAVDSTEQGQGRHFRCSSGTCDVYPNVCKTSGTRWISSDHYPVHCVS